MSPPALRVVLEHLAALSGPGEPWDAARRMLDEPWTVAVVGRIGVGKTTLVNRRTGGRRLVGLGGVTRSVEAVGWSGGLLVDTPGIDDPWAAVEVLGPVLDEVDAVVWVLDGLQPMTGSEREVLRDTLPDRIPLWLVVSRVDLVDPAEVDPVLERIRDLGTRHSPLEVLAADLRAGPVPDRVGPGSDVRRRQRLDHLLAPARAAFEARPGPAPVDRIVARWRDEVRAVVREVERKVEAGAIRHELDALTRVTEAAPQVVAAVAQLAGDPPLILPLPEAPARTTLHQVAAGLSGGEGARRALRTVAARWLAEGEVAIREEWAGAVGREGEVREHDERVRAWAALDGEVRR